jgi:hypothetical protein
MDRNSETAMDWRYDHVALDEVQTCLAYAREVIQSGRKIAVRQ